MAITLNKYAKQCEEADLSSGKFKPDTSPTLQMYGIGRHWRDLIEAKAEDATLSEWSAREEAAAEVILAASVYLRRIGCRDIEQLIKDCVAARVRASALD